MLAAPLDLVLVRKIGAPGHEELAAGALVNGERPELVLNADVVRNYGIDQAWLDRQQALQLAEIERRRALYLGRSVAAVDRGADRDRGRRRDRHRRHRPGRPARGAPGGTQRSWCWRCRWPRRRCWRGSRQRPTVSSACMRRGT